MGNTLGASPPLVRRLQELYGMGPIPRFVPQRTRPAVAAPPRSRKGYRIEEIKYPIVSGQAPAFSLTSLLERYQYSSDPNAENEVVVRFGGFRKQGRFHPSEICKEDVCLRALTYELLGAPAAFKIVAKLRRIFDNGHFVHARTQWSLREAIRAAGGELYEEVSFKSAEDRISGTTDGLFTLSGWPYLLEVKSMNKANFKDLGALPWDEHYDQVNIYMRYFGVMSAYILVECKDNQDLKDYLVRFDEQRWKRVENVQQTALGYAMASDLPEQVTKENGCQGDRCKFYNVCRKGCKWALPAWDDVADVLWEKGYVKSATT